MEFMRQRREHGPSLRGNQVRRFDRDDLRRVLLDVAEHDPPRLADRVVGMLAVLQFVDGVGEKFAVTKHDSAEKSRAGIEPENGGVLWSWSKEEIQSPPESCPIPAPCRNRLGSSGAGASLTRQSFSRIAGCGRAVC